MKRNRNSSIVAATVLAAILAVGSWWTFAATRPVETFEVYGITKRTGVLTWSEDMTLLRALASAGGYTVLAKGDREIAYIIRSGVLLAFNPAAIEAGVKEDPKIQPRDIVVVPRQ